ncbi:MAG TPA: RNA methyltransferase [Solirubrobacteraceae bacterium]|nr:RNA methyltransferase [Solirubrobacteraceae bacterium]
MTTTISSPQNAHVKQIRRLATRRERARTGLFAAEGEDLVRAAEAAGRRAVFGLRAADCEGCGADFAPAAPAALAAASSLGSSTRVIGVYEQRWAELTGPRCVYLHAVADPGNVGTVLRGATAFGVDCVALGPGCADPHGPKAVRASMGAIFAVNLARAGDPGALPGRTVALSAAAGEELAAAVRGARELTLLVGAERGGLPAALADGCERTARIAIRGDSLNAAMAATVAMYEATRESFRVPGA